MCANSGLTLVRFPRSPHYVAVLIFIYKIGKCIRTARPAGVRALTAALPPLRVSTNLPENWIINEITSQSNE